MEKYDDASWHFDGDFPPSLSRENAATHIGMFLSWNINNNLISNDLIENFQHDIIKIKKGLMTGAQFIMSNCDEKLTDDDLNDMGNAFARDYYNDDTDFSKKNASYFEDYATAFCNDNAKNYETIYHVEDSVSNYNIIKQIIDKRFSIWKKS